MIHLDVVGAGGWISVMLWAGMFVGLPIWAYRFGKTVGRDDARDKADAEYHERWMREFGAP